MYNNMTHKYFCKICNYDTENKYNFSIHIKTSKHLKLMKSTNTPNLKILNEEVNNKPVTCEYCNKSISGVDYKNKHYDKCQKKKDMEHEYLLHRLNLAEQRTVNAIQIIKQLERDNREQDIQIRSILEIFKHMGNTTI